MKFIEKHQNLIIFLAIPFGLLFGKIDIIANNAEKVVVPVLFCMLVGVFFNIKLDDFRQTLLNYKFSLVTILINFVWTPILIWFLGKIFLGFSPVLQIGLIMLMVTPCTDWYLIFTGMAKGNVPLSATVLPINLVLQIVLLPVYLLIFGNVSQTINFGEVLMSITIMLILPFIIGQIGQRVFKQINQKKLSFDIFGSLQVILLSVAVMCMFASKGGSLLENTGLATILLIPMLLFYVINFILAQLIGRLFHYSYQDTASLTLTTIAKNSPMTLGVALMAFPNEPLIHLIMLVEPLIELPIMIIVTKLLLLIRTREIKQPTH